MITHKITVGSAFTTIPFKYRDNKREMGMRFKQRNDMTVGVRGGVERSGGLGLTLLGESLPRAIPVPQAG